MRRADIDLERGLDRPSAPSGAGNLQLPLFRLPDARASNSLPAAAPSATASPPPPLSPRASTPASPRASPPAPVTPTANRSQMQMIPTPLPAVQGPRSVHELLSSSEQLKQYIPAFVEAGVDDLQFLLGETRAQWDQALGKFPSLLLCSALLSTRGLLVCGALQTACVRWLEVWALTCAWAIACKSSLCCSASRRERRRRATDSSPRPVVWARVCPKARRSFATARQAVRREG